jgi:hypothetical protein
VKMFIHKAEEKALGIDQNATEKYRRDDQIPDPDGFAMISKRGRSETMSTNLSDKHVIVPIPSYHICSCHLVFLFSYHGFLICLSCNHNKFQLCLRQSTSALMGDCYGSVEYL